MNEQITNDTGEPDAVKVARPVRGGAVGNVPAMATRLPPTLPLFVTANDRQPPKDFTAHVTDLITSNRRDEAVTYFMTEGMGAPGLVIPLMHLMPGAWAQLKAVAHTLPYDAQLLESHTAGKPLSGKDWRSVIMPTLVMADTKKLSPKLIASVLVEFFEGE